MLRTSLRFIYFLKCVNYPIVKRISTNNLFVYVSVVMPLHLYSFSLRILFHSYSCSQRKLPTWSFVYFVYTTMYHAVFVCLTTCDGGGSLTLEIVCLACLICDLFLMISWFTFDIFITCLYYFYEMFLILSLIRKTVCY